MNRLIKKNKGNYKFSQAVCEKLEYYVYSLANPNGKVFYIGKGKNNRIFQHLKGVVVKNRKSEKIDTIKKILRKGKKIQYAIIRHGMNEKEAFEVESALIDHIGLTGLTNKVYGQDSEDRGKMSPKEIIAICDAKKAKITDPVMLIKINRKFTRDISENDLYYATRYCWKLGERRYKAKYALPTYRGIIREVYEIKSWHSTKNKTGKRWEFRGKIADESIRKKYVSKSVNHLIKQGAQNPIKYIKC
ncbi:MAG: hypothetical protein V1871_02830 [Planctomycetota bacterium]